MQQNAIVKKKRSKTYSISDLQSIKAYILNAYIEFNAFCELIEIDLEEILKINEISKNGPNLLKKGQRILVPGTSNNSFLSNDCFEELSLEDIIHYDLEIKKQQLNPQIFFLYYVTEKGEVNGKLGLYDDFIDFQPLSVDYQGLYDFSSYSLTKNSKMGFKVDYLDIIDEPIKIPLIVKRSKQDNLSDELSIDYLIQFELCNNGYAKAYNKDTKNKGNNMKNSKKGICSFCLKIRPQNLVGKQLNNSEKERIADDQIKLIKEKISNKYSKNINSQKALETLYEDNETIQPYFDINFKNIFEFVNLKHINENMNILHEIFGYKLEQKDCSFINNQSRAPLAYIFPELIANKLKEKCPNNNLSNPEQSVKIQFVMESESDIITQEQANFIDQNLPSYLRANMWINIYSNVRHGKSYRTMLRQSNNKGPVIILLQDKNGSIFGGYYSADLNVKDRFVGNGESFLFKFTGKDDFKVWPATGENEFFCRCDNDCIMMGSDPFAGFYIDNELKKGSSNICKTFNNEQLSYNSQFLLRKQEIWGFDE